MAGRSRHFGRCMHVIDVSIALGDAATSYGGCYLGCYGRCLSSTVIAAEMLYERRNRPVFRMMLGARLPHNIC